MSRQDSQPQPQPQPRSWMKLVGGFACEGTRVRTRKLSNFRQEEIKTFWWFPCVFTSVYVIMLPYYKLTR